MSKTARGYTTLFLSAIEEAELDPVVKQFAKGCIKRGIPIAAVADWQGVTRASVYNWFTGKTSPRQSQMVRMKKVVARWTRARSPKPSR
jgi:hypothetical protein